MKFVKCVSLIHKNNLTDPDLIRGAIYEVIDNRVLSEAGEYITVRFAFLGEDPHTPFSHGQELTKPSYLFALYDQHIKTSDPFVASFTYGEILLMIKLVDQINSLVAEKDLPDFIFVHEFTNEIIKTLLNGLKRK